VRRAFRQLAARSHPDRFPSADEGERRRLMQRFAELSAAYHALTA
jgi:DnaJ-domain-containing protein 1